eukprot:g12298.t1 g12298   contig6:1649790-1650416(+)
MNSLVARTISQRSQAMVASRFLSGGPIPTSSVVESGGFKVLGMPHLSTSAMKSQYRKVHWLSDPATYPLLVCLGAAGALCSGFGIYFLATAPDVQISPLKRNKTIRDWK